MQFLPILVLFALVYLSVTLPIEEKPKPKLIKGKTIDESFEKVVEEIKKLDSGIVGWEKLQPGKCHLLEKEQKYRCIASIPRNELNLKKNPLKFEIDIGISDGKVTLFDVHGGLEAIRPATFGLIDIWSEMRDAFVDTVAVDTALLAAAAVIG